MLSEIFKEGHSSALCNIRKELELYALGATESQRQLRGMQEGFTALA
jgi:hypothetical protein